MSARLKLHQMRFLVLYAGLLSLAIGFLFVMPSIDGTAFGKGNPPKSPTWQLMDYNQKGCVNIANPYSDRTTYYGIWIKGRWTHKINVGVSNAPSGSTWWSFYTPIPPGSSDGTYSLADVALQVAPGTPTGTYIVTLWADDGVTQETVPVTLVVATTCSGY